MTDHEAELLAQLLATRPDRRQDLLASAEISDDAVERLLELASTADQVLIEQIASRPLADDPVAAMLGLVPDPSCRLDRSGFRSARLRADLKVSELASRLQGRGWTYSAADLNRWQTRRADDVPPAVVRVLAEILNVDVDRLIMRGQAEAADPLQDVRSTGAFAALAHRWAVAQHVALSVAEAQLSSRLLASVHRGSEPDPSALLVALEELVQSMEGGHGT